MTPREYLPCLPKLTLLTPFSPASGFSSGKAPSDYLPAQYFSCWKNPPGSSLTHPSCSQYWLSSPPWSHVSRGFRAGHVGGTQGTAAPPGRHGDQIPLPSRERSLPFFPRYWGALLNLQFSLDFRSKLWGKGQRSLGRPRLESLLCHRLAVITRQNN